MDAALSSLEERQDQNVTDACIMLTGDRRKDNYFECVCQNGEQVSLQARKGKREKGYSINRQVWSI